MLENAKPMQWIFLNVLLFCSIQSYHEFNYNTFVCEWGCNLCPIWRKLLHYNVLQCYKKIAISSLISLAVVD